MLDPRIGGQGLEQTRLELRTQPQFLRTCNEGYVPEPLPRLPGDRLSAITAVVVRHQNVQVNSQLLQLLD